MNKMSRIEDAPANYDSCGQIIGVSLMNYLTATGLDEGLLLNFGAERLEFKKKFRLPKMQASAESDIIL
jgi:hypothetical protein